MARLEDGELAGTMLTWAWKTPQGRPVFNFVLGERDFSSSDRMLILATEFYEYTAPKDRGEIEGSALLHLESAVVVLDRRHPQRGLLHYADD